MKKLLFLGGLLSLQVSAFATIRYVKQNGAGTQAGNSWANASGDLQLMINQSSGSVADTIWVAAGTYLPNRPANNLGTIDAANRNNAFTFIKNVVLFGGFPAAGNPQMNNRNWVTNVTTLSGNIGVAANTDNAYHVVATLGAAVTADFLMDGFTVTAGVANVATNITVNGIVLQERSGAGWNNTGGSPTLRNMIFEDNIIGNDGTGMGVAFFNAGGNPQVTNAVFRNNNGTLSRGGAWYNQSGNPVLNNVLMHGNITNIGGAWYQDAGDAVLNNAVIAGNTAFAGGACYLLNGNITFNNSIVFHNTATSVAGVNLIISPPTNSPTASYNYSLVQGFAGGSNGNLNGNTQTPQFINPLSGSAAPTAAGNYRLTAASPCVDAGNSALIPAGVLTDLDNLGRTTAASVDMGAYEYNSVPLGVDMSGFSATAHQCTVQLSWNGENETALSHYEIESAVATHFSLAGKVNALNKTGATYRYALTQTVPVMHYRIRSVDRDGTPHYTAVLPVSVSCGGDDQVSIAPNPATEQLRISCVQQGQHLIITDVSGKEIIRRQIDAPAIIVSLQQFIPGIYHARILNVSGQMISCKKFVVQ